MLEIDLKPPTLGFKSTPQWIKEAIFCTVNIATDK